MTRDGGPKARTVAKQTKGAKSKLLSPALGRYRHSTHQQDGSISLRDFAGSQDSTSSLSGLSVMLEPGIAEDSAQLAVWSADPHFQDGSTGVTSSLTPTTVLSDNLPPAHSTTPSQYKGKSLAKLAYLLFSNLSNNAKEPPKATTGGSLKEEGPDSTILPEEETASNITVPHINAAVVVSRGSGIFNPTSENLATNTLLSTSSSLQNPLFTVNTEGVTTITATLEELMGQILVVIPAIIVSQEETRRETKEQLSQLNTHLILLSTRVSQLEQRVSDLEDTNNQVETTTSRVQSELEDLQNKLDEMENRSRRSNLRYVGVLEEMEVGSSVAKVVSELIVKIILPDRAKPEGDLSIIRADRVPFVCPVNSKHPHTILVNFGDFRIKEQILSQARKVRKFKLDDSSSFCVFPDMSVAAAHRCQEFVGLIDDFKRWGAQAGLVQLAKLKVLYKGQAKVFQNVQEARNFLQHVKKQGNS
ncbi:hypothetical protein NDU88_007164 [Pleurodeles waltl]|uniref:Uncharacterized protein n=1 Tax=Pleurodeles waltl TaxID=8319 RepID=A0AAV7UP42_PLEWA|nr:hypothetical protein NDU88_007164 [Pleurodeles waltl]